MRPSAGFPVDAGIFATAFSAAIGAILPAQADWIFDTFVKSCEESGGIVGSTVEQYLNGEKFICKTNGSGASSSSRDASKPCSAEAKKNIDWVFADGGAHQTMQRLLASGSSKLDAVVGAQSHNPRAQQSILACRAWAIAYLGGLAGGSEPGRKLSAESCRCISVLPTGRSVDEKPMFSVRNDCSQMNVSVRFAGDILKSSGERAFSNWTSPKRINQGNAIEVGAPSYEFLTISGVKLSSGTNSFVCNY